MNRGHKVFFFCHSKERLQGNSSWANFLVRGSVIQPVLFITDFQSYTRAWACWQLLRGDECGMLLMVTLEFFLQTEPPARVHVFAHFRDTPLGPRHVPGSFRVTPKALLLLHKPPWLMLTFTIANNIMPSVVKLLIVSSRKGWFGLLESGALRPESRLTSAF